MFQIWPLPLKTPLSLTLACQWALAASSLLSSSCFIPALLLAASLCPSPTLATLPNRQDDCALAHTTFNSLWSRDQRIFHFGLNEYLNIFVYQNIKRMNIRIYSCVPVCSEQTFIRIYSVQNLEAERIFKYKLNMWIQL